MDNSLQPSQTNSGRFTHFLSQHWFFLLSLILGLYIGLPFLAPVFMKIGWSGPARVIYLVYSWLCHQLPQRSFFFFGPQMTYTLAEVQNAWQNTTEMWILRQFIGNPEMGWKVAWSDRMVAMFTSLWLLGLLWWPLRKRVKPLPWQGLLLLIVPISL